MNHPTLNPPSRAGALAAFVLVFLLACGGVALAATGYAQLLQGVRAAAPQPVTPARTLAMDDWRPPGCVFPPNTAFGVR